MWIIIWFAFLFYMKLCNGESIGKILLVLQAYKGKVAYTTIIYTLRI